MTDARVLAHLPNNKSSRCCLSASSPSFNMDGQPPHDGIQFSNNIPANPVTPVTPVNPVDPIDLVTPEKATNPANSSSQYASRADDPAWQAEQHLRGLDIVDDIYAKLAKWDAGELDELPRINEKMRAWLGTRFPDIAEIWNTDLRNRYLAARSEFALRRVRGVPRPSSNPSATPGTSNHASEPEILEEEEAAEQATESELENDMLQSPGSNGRADATLEHTSDATGATSNTPVRRSQPRAAKAVQGAAVSKRVPGKKRKGPAKLKLTIPHFESFIFLPEGDTDGRREPISKLPEATAACLQASLETLFQLDHQRACTVTRPENSGTYVNSQICLGIHILSRDRSKFAPLTTSCSTCNRFPDKRPCVRLEIDPATSETVLVFYPRPSDHQFSAVWTEPGFWLGPGVWQPSLV
ncbi:hypothetical protein C7974DRAFT_170651 [Boeremia exigua]|uniref:uncharacterized protein n=1 Tax=Boeremia exigua TaxID=749465 RepID=UPI001E8E0085|nr:uncharacterized protein C7974DRAFT_170651 [Boeremia exigua]KAH6633400.1 hypothetical protein C7974DRAFT_170651 [Boeremia exigua]